MTQQQALLDRLLRYVKIDTTSSETSETHPSTKIQFDLANLMVVELKELGLKDVCVDEFCNVTATLPSNLPKTDKAYGKVPVLGLMAHLDTSCQTSGTNVKPQVIKNYQGGDIPLPGKPGLVIKESEHLKNSVGHTLVTSDGTTLLGADDKSGIAIIMTALETLINNPSILHGDIKAAFTPDEETGTGTEKFDIKKFGAQYAYTVDGECLGELNNETFSGDMAIVTITGVQIHPGYAKNVMVNAVKCAADIIARLPKNTSPETTEGKEPYLHPCDIVGNEEKVTIKWLLRDFKTAGLKDLRQMIEKIIADVQKEYPKAKIQLDIKEQYRNMFDKLQKTPAVVDHLLLAMERAGVKPVLSSARGGTDGSRLTEMGLPTPNYFAGFFNYHSPTEWASVNVMEASLKTTLNLAQIWVEKSR